ncbi:hypothetical protein M5K25_004877 [Dendrobium thyrsiflorum]|uniref:Uncharacterized protein n=1 Tax=Dendrobium thyrsiflorum TaxID=117978 RepID=A0ABD0VN44_DENTH
MDKQDTPITVHLGRGARIQLANTVINTGSTGATIQFGSVDFSAITARTTVPRAHLPAPQITARDIPQGRISVFERLSQPETLTAKRVVDGRKVSVVTADTTALPRETVTSGIYDAEASSSGGKLNRRQRRKRNAELRAQQLSVPVHPSNIPAQELEATIPTQNGFSNLKWVKRNSSTGELKKSFWEQRREVPTPPKKKEPESLSARVYRVLRTVKEKGLTKKRFQRPLTADVRRTPPRERLSFTRVERRERRNNPLGEHRGVTPELHIRGSTTERSRWKGKQVWRPRPRRDDERKEREIDLGVTSGTASRRSASTNKQRQKWVQKKTHDDTYPDGRHLGEFSKGSRRSLTPPKKEVNFDRSPRVEEILIPNQEPEIHWRRRSEVQVQEEEYNDEDTMEVEVVYMVSHIDDNDGDDEEDRRSQTHEQAHRRRRRARSVTSQSVRSSEEGEEVEENPFAEETLTLAQMRKQMRRQMKEKDKEISHLNEKMTEMMTQMTTMMEMMQKATSVGPTPAQPINHAASIAPAKPPDPHVPQASGIKGTPEGGNEAVDNTRQRTLQNVASASEPGEAYSISPFKSDKKKQVSYDQGVYNADKGKQPMQYEDKPKQVYTPNPQPKLVLGGNDKPRAFSGGGERPRQAMGTGDRTKESTRVVTSSSVPPPKEVIKEKSIQGEQWETVVSKKTIKMLKQLEGVPGVKWKSPIEPVLNLKWLPVPHAPTSKQQPGQASSSKSDKKKAKSAKKKAKIKKPKEKKTATQRVIDSLGEYYQTARQPIKLGDFMTELKINEEEEGADDEFLPIETCLFISATSEILEREEYAKEAAPEFCLMVSSMDYSSEEDLYFPREDDTDPDIASQMEQVNLEDNSESTGESPDATMADSEENTASNKSESDEVAQVQLRSDAKYFVPKKLKSSSSLEAKASTSKTEKRPKQGGEMKQRGRKRVAPTLPKAVATPKTKRAVPHLGSDTEEDEVIPVKARKNCQPAARRKKKAEDSDPDYDYESTYANSVQGIFSRRIDSLSVSDSVLVVTRIPLRHFKEVIPREVHNVEELVTFYVCPHKEKGGPGRLFYSVGKLNEEENRDWYRRIIDSGELLPTRLPRFNTKVSVSAYTGDPLKCLGHHLLQYTKILKVRKEDFLGYTLQQIELEQHKFFCSLKLKHGRREPGATPTTRQRDKTTTYTRISLRGGRKCVAVLVTKRVIQKFLFRCLRRTGEPPIRALVARMDKQDTPITVHLGRGARIQLANTVINTGSTGATIQFGSVDFSAITARTTVPRAHLPAPQITARAIPQGRISVFERLSQPETLTAKRVVDGRKVSVVTADTTALPRETVTSGIYDAEASSSGGKLNRRQRRKRNAELRAQQLSVPVHPSNIPAQELEATIPTQNGFSNLKWVKRNSSTGELKKSFWEQRREVPTPPKKKEPESLSARVYRVLRTVKEKGLTKKRFQRPLTADVRRTPPRERLSFTRVERRERRNNPLGEHRGVTPELHIRGSTTERSRWKGKQVWRPRPRRDDERKEREIDLGVTSGTASRRSASTNKQRQKWVQKKTHDDTYPDGRHLGEFSKGSRRSLTPPKKEVNFDRSPRVEEILIPNQEPEIHWRRRSEVQVQEEEYNDEDTMEVEVVYMVSHIDDNDGDDEEDRRSQTHEQAHRRRRRARSVTSQSVRSSEEGEEVEENPFAEETLTLAQMRKQMRRQMKEKDKEISHLNEKMTEMMTQMTTMMEMMQKATSVGPTPAQPINHAASIAPAKPPDPHVPQASGIKGTPEGGNEAVDNTRQRTLQNVASASEPGEAYSISPFKSDKKKQVSYDQGVYNADKGKQPMQYEDKPKQVYTPNPQPKLVLGGNDKPRAFSGGGERPRQAMGTGEQWETVVSKKTIKMLKQLEGVPGVKWKSPIEPVLNLKWLPVPHAPTSKQQPGQASSSKSDKKKAKSAKKKAKIKKPKEKKTATQRVIDSLGEYYQTARQPIKLGDFMTELKINEEEEGADDEFLPIETCLFISATSEILEREEYAKEAAPEFCLMVSSMDYSSEEDLYFPREDDTDPDIASQMEQVNLEDNSESTGESPDATMADSEENTASNKSESDEVAQVQLRSGKLLPPPPKKGISNKDKGKEIIIDDDIIPKDPKKKDIVAKGIDYNILSHLRKIPAQLSIYDALIMSKDLRETLIKALKDPERYEAYFAERNMTELKSSSSLEAKASTSKTEKRPKQGGEMKQRGRKRVAPTLPKAVATPKTKRAVPHLGSDTEEDEVIPVKARKNCQPAARRKKKAEDSDPDYDYESTYANSVQGIFSRRIDSLSVSDSVLVVTRIPLRHFKEVIPREVHNVEELVTFYVCPHKEKGGPGRLFYSVGKLNEEENRDWYRRIIDSGELLPTRLPRFNTKVNSAWGAHFLHSRSLKPEWAYEVGLNKPRCGRVAGSSVYSTSHKKDRSSRTPVSADGRRKAIKTLAL